MLTAVFFPWFVTLLLFVELAVFDSQTPIQIPPPMEFGSDDNGGEEDEEDEAAVPPPPEGFSEPPASPAVQVEVHHEEEAEPATEAAGAATPRVLSSGSEPSWLQSPPPVPISPSASSTSDGWRVIDCSLS